MSSLDSFHPLVLGIFIVAGFSIIIEIGYRAGKRIGGGEGLSKHPVEASVTTAILSLMAFMLGFSFATVASRHANRRNLVMEDSNAAGTLYLRADFLPEEHIKPTKNLIREYVQIRAEAAKTRKVEDITPALERCSEIQSELWKIAVKARNQTTNTTLNLFIGSLNELIDTDAKRQNVALVNRLPAALWYTLTFLGTVAITMIGLSSGLHGRRSRVATSALIVSFSVVIVLIIDLDRPVRSLFKTGDHTAERTLRSMQP